MAVDLSLESTEKYFWTWLDIFRLGPRGFSDQLMDRPDRYLSSAKFFLGSLVISGAIIFVGAETLEESHLTALTSFKTYLGADAKTFVYRHILYATLFILWGILGNRFVLWWPLKSPATIADVFTAKFYASGALVPFAAFDALSLCMIVWISPHVSIEAIRWMVIASFLSELLVFGTALSVYDLWSVSAFCQVRIRRLFEGQAILVITGTVCGGCVGFAFGGSVGAVRGGWESTPIHTWPYIVGFVLISLMCVSFAFLIGSAALWTYIYFLRRRLAKLQKAVQSEYATYRETRAVL